ncbi:MAG: hypothetical protein PHW96_04985 [Candidatus Nanoarchaeia archaeon]|nr:hypothetical protein [Candidatus Nanoarchaeia archaeon]
MESLKGNINELEHSFKHHLGMYVKQRRAYDGDFKFYIAENSRMSGLIEQVQKLTDSSNSEIEEILEIGCYDLGVLMSRIERFIENARKLCVDY